MQRTGAQIVWECLVREGVTTVFGYPGGAILPTYDAMLDYPIHHVLVRHEQGAAHMADGYARASGKVGVAIATSGPGATNLTTGIATAMLDSVAHRLHHRPGLLEAARQRRLPGDRRHRHHAADHQAQLARDRRAADRAHDARGVRDRALGPARARCWSTSARTRSRRRPTSSGPRRVHLPGLHEPEPPDAREPGARRRADREGRAAADPGGRGRDPLGRLAGAHRVRREGRDPGGAHAARPRRLPAEPPALPRHDGHARRGLRQQRDPARRPAARVRDALRRPRHRQPQDLRAPREEDPRRDRPLRDRQERQGGRGARGRPARRARGARAARAQEAPRRLAAPRSSSGRDETRSRDILHKESNGPAAGAARDPRPVEDDRRRRGGRDRRGPAPDVGGAVLQARRSRAR